VTLNPNEPIASIPMFIFTSAEQADPLLHEQAWGAAAVLMGIILISSLVARWFADRSVRRLKGER
jgi:ABC-type phosphate transport system permease subunit